LAALLPFSNFIVGRWFSVGLRNEIVSGCEWHAINAFLNGGGSFP
jgi:hypothetical protein